jgi:hypothetical protein
MTHSTIPIHWDENDRMVIPLSGGDVTFPDQIGLELTAAAGMLTIDRFSVLGQALDIVREMNENFEEEAR